jgi:putative endonuclease
MWGFFMPCLCYILYSKDVDKYYVGHTCDSMEERLKKHNTKHKGFTGNAFWSVVYTECFPGKAEALTRELQIKGWKSRKRIEALIKAGSEHPDS